MTEPGEKTRAPEVPFNSVLIKALKSVDSAVGLRGNSPFVSAPFGIGVQANGKTLLTVADNDIVILGKSFQDKLVKKPGKSATPDINTRLDNFLNGISENLVGLNHVGINYFCTGIEQEAQGLKNLATTSGAALYEDPESEPHEKWYFLGNAEKWQTPLVEVVLGEEKDRDKIGWIPQFQIDIDTTLALDQIKTLTDRYLGKGFVKWQLDLEGLGTVLTMGAIGHVGGVRIALGIGTNTRDVEGHRKFVLKPV